MLLRIARRNLLYDKRRFAASLAGVCFSVQLVIVQLGLFAGLAANASQVIDRPGRCREIRPRLPRPTQGGHVGPPVRRRRPASARRG